MYKRRFPSCKRKQNSDLLIRLLTYIPDKDYVRQNANQLSTNSLKKLDPQFKGYLEYRNWTGDVVSVLRVEKGKVVRIYKISKKDKKLNTNNKYTKKAISKSSIITLDDEPSCIWVSTPIYDTVCEVIENGDPEADVLNEVECTYGVVGYEEDYVCTWEQNPDPDPCPWGGCDENPEEPCIECEEPEEPEEPDPNDPCNQKNVMKSQAANTQISTANTTILNNLNSSDTLTNSVEYGTEKKLSSSTSMNNYMSSNVRTDGSSNSFSPSFTWDSVNGYTIGATHSHPGTSAPSPGDVMWLFSNSTDTALTNAGITSIDFYKRNASVTVVTSLGNYVVSIADWSTIGNLGSVSTLTAKYKSEGQKYFDDNPSATNQEASEYVLLKTFGNTINLYKAPLNSTEYKPRKIDASTNKTTDKPC